MRVGTWILVGALVLVAPASPAFAAGDDPAPGASKVESPAAASGPVEGPSSACGLESPAQTPEDGERIFTPEAEAAAAEPACIPCPFPVGTCQGYPYCYDEDNGCCYPLKGVCMIFC